MNKKFLWFDLKNLSLAEKNENLCFRAVEQNGVALAFVPLSLRSYHLCLMAINNDHDKRFCSALCFVPDSKKSWLLCCLAVQQKPSALLAVPSRYHTKTLFHWAINAHSKALLFVPKAQRTAELCNLAGARDVNAYWVRPDGLPLLV